MNQILAASSFVAGDGPAQPAGTPRLVVDVGRSLLVAADPMGRAAWGLGGETAAADPRAADIAELCPPIALDAAMPGLRTIAAVLAGPRAGWSGPHHLVAWTASGVQRWSCLIGPAPADGGQEGGGAGLACLALVSARRPGWAEAPHAASGGCLAPETSSPGSPEEFARLAHELRTPLSAIASIADVLTEAPFGPLGDARYTEYARAVGETARHAIGVVAGMLVRPAGEPDERAITEIDLNALAAGAVRSVARLAEHRACVVACNLAGGLPRVIADEVGVRQILLNLLSNALTHAGPGARLAVRSGSGASGETWVEVEDDGPGRAEEITEAVNGRGHWRTEPDGAAHGIGLPLAAEIARRNGARLEVAAVEPRGARVRLSFERSRTLPV